MAVLRECGLVDLVTGEQECDIRFLGRTRVCYRVNKHVTNKKKKLKYHNNQMPDINGPVHLKHLGTPKHRKVLKIDDLKN